RARTVIAKPRHGRQSLCRKRESRVRMSLLAIPLWLAIGGPAGSTGAAERQGAPAVQAVMALSAIPVARASGIGGPINRFALDVTEFDPLEAGARVECRYADASSYRCRFEPVAGLSAAGRRRINVDVPDIGR